MAWARWGDTIATDPRVLRLGARKLEVMGFLVLVTSLAGQHRTDRRVDAGMCALAGGDGWESLVTDAVRQGLMTKVPRRRDEWDLIDDPEFLHLRSRAEIDWERQRKRDNANPQLTMPVKERDGDGCRYCGRVVYWKGDRRSARAGTYDHRIPGQAGTKATVVVACAECNGTRGGYQRQGLTLEQIDELVPLLPEPPEPYYSAFTADQLTKYFGRPFAATKARPGTQPENARPATPSQARGAASAGDGAPGGATWQPDQDRSLTTGQARPGTQHGTAADRTVRRDPAPSTGPQPTEARPGSRSENARYDVIGDGLPAGSPDVQAPDDGITAGQDPPGSADSRRSQVYGPGRVGSGRAGSPQPVPVVPAHPPGRSSPARRRGSRGGRRKG